MGNPLGRVLVVEDNLLFNQLLGDMIRSLGFAVTTAFSPHQARRALAEARFDCLVTDLKLGNELAGVALAGEALRHGASRVILTSGHPRPSDLNDDVGFLPKPFTVSQLERAIDG